MTVLRVTSRLRLDIFRSARLAGLPKVVFSYHYLAVNMVSPALGSLKQIFGIYWLGTLSRESAHVLMPTAL